MTRLAWPDLPADLDPADVRVETDRGQVRVVETELVATDEAPAESSDSADELRDKLNGLTALQDALRAELELLDQVSPPTEASSAALRPDLFIKGLEAITDRRRAALTELRRATAEHTQVGRALERISAAGQKSISHRQTLVVTIDAAEPGPAKVRVTYASGWATWRPLYHLQLSPGADRVDLIRYGDVWQETGEDWAQVALRLSTAEPERGLQLPTIRPWILKVSSSLDDDMKSLYRRSRVEAPLPSAPEVPDGLPTLPPAPAVSTRDVTGDFDAPDDGGFDEYATQFDEQGVFAEVTSPSLLAARSMLVTDDGAPPPPLAPPEPLAAPTLLNRVDMARPAAAATQSLTAVGPARPGLGREPEPREASGGIDVEISVVRPFDAKSGSDRHRVQLGRREYPLQLWYILRPGLRDHAFGRAEIVNEDADPILAGPTSLFVGGAFFGHTRLATTPGRGKLTLDLGAETGIKCARRSETQVRREGLINKDEVHAVEVTIDIESFLTVPATLEVQDQVPVATDPQVRVRLLSTDPGDARLDDETGLVTFSVRIGPQSKLQLRLTYEVGAPAGFRLSQGLAEEVTP